MLDDLVVGEFGKGGADFFVLLPQLAALDRVVVQFELPGEDEDLPFAEEVDAEEVGVGEGVALDEFVLLEVDVEEGDAVGSLDEEGYLPAVVEELALADVQRLYREAQVFDFGLLEHRNAGLLVQLEFVAQQRVGSPHQDG